MKKKQARRKFRKCVVTFEIDLLISDPPKRRKITSIFSAEEVEKNYNKSSDWWTEKAVLEYIEKKGLVMSQIEIVESVVAKE